MQLPRSADSLRRPLLKVAVPLAMLAMLAVGSARADSQIWSRQDEFVRIERQDDSQAPQNEHPVRLAPAQLAAMLGALQVRFEDEAEPLPVFSSEEVNLLSATLADGLARADPRQDIRFTTIGSHKRGAGGLVSRRLVNSGRAFYSGDRLNLLFGEVHGEYRKRNLYGQRDQDFRVRRDASRSSPSPLGWRLEVVPGAALRMQDGSERPDWLLISPASISLADTPPAAAAGKTSGTGPSAKSAEAGTARERLARLKLLQDEDLIPDEVYRQKLQEILDEAAAPGAGVEERLRTLKQLREEGLITEQDYRARVQEVVDEL